MVDEVTDKDFEEETKDGEVVDKITGFHNKPQLAKILDGYSD